MADDIVEITLPGRAGKIFTRGIDFLGQGDVFDASATQLHAPKIARLGRNEGATNLRKTKANPKELA